MTSSRFDPGSTSVRPQKSWTSLFNGSINGPGLKTLTTTSKLKKAILTNFTTDKYEAKFIGPRLFFFFFKPIAPKNLLLEIFFFFFLFWETSIRNLKIYRKFYAPQKSDYRKFNITLKYDSKNKYNFNIYIQNIH